MADKTDKKRLTLDPDSETPRKYLANITTRFIHRTDSDDPACVPALTDNLGWGDEIEHFQKFRLIPCPFCLREVLNAPQNS